MAHLAADSEQVTSHGAPLVGFSPRISRPDCTVGYLEEGWDMNTPVGWTALYQYIQENLNFGYTLDKRGKTWYTSRLIFYSSLTKFFEKNSCV